MSADWELDRIGPTKRPQATAIGYQSWRNLSFLHWRVKAEQLRPLIPRELTLDTWRGECWVGLVPFQMRWVRPAYLPALPWLSFFLETNLRTYVHDGETPGVWFFSLEAARLPAVKIARWKWNLKYFWARMRFSKNGNQVEYQSKRLNFTDRAEAKTKVTIEEPSQHPPFTATPGTLEHFLAERYVLYTATARGQLLKGYVHHVAYPLRRVTAFTCEQSIADSMQVQASAPEHVLFSDGVDVEIFPLTPLDA